MRDTRNGSLRSARSVSSLNSVDSSATVQPADAAVAPPSVYPRTASATASVSSTNNNLQHLDANSKRVVSKGASAASVARTNGNGAGFSPPSATPSAAPSAAASTPMVASTSAATPASATPVSAALPAIAATPATASSSTPSANPAPSASTTTPTSTATPEPRRRTRNSSASSASELGITPARTQYCVVIVLASRNNTFDRKSLILPFYPEVLKLGRQTSQKTVPSPDNGYFDSRVLSRQHAEIWADRLTRKVWMKDAKSSNGTYINGERLSQDGRESEPHELKRNDLLELGIDIANNDGSALLHRKISAVVERISVMSLQSADEDRWKGTGAPLALTQVNVGGQGMGTGQQTLNAGQGQGQSLAQVRVRPPKKSEALDVALFGDVDTSLEDLALGHSRNSVGGLFMKSGISSSANIETAVKTLAEQIHSTRVETAKLDSVRKMLSQIQSNQKKNKSLKDDKKDQMKQYASVEMQQRVEELEVEVESGRRRIKELEEKVAVAGAAAGGAGALAGAVVGSVARSTDADTADTKSVSSTSDTSTIELLQKQLAESQQEVEQLRERAILAEQQVENSAIQLSLLEQEKQKAEENKPRKSIPYASLTVLFIGIGFVVANRFFREHFERLLNVTV